VRPVSVAIIALVLGSCASTNQNLEVQTTASNLGTPGGSSTAPAAGSSLFQGLGRFAQALGAAARGDNTRISSPAVTGSATPGPAVSNQVPVDAAPRAAATRRRVASVTSEASARPSEPITVASATVAYEKAMLQGDTRSMARAAARLTRGPVTADSIRALNAKLGIEADEAMVSAVVRAAR
jgi:hypothetical protein